MDSDRQMALTLQKQFDLEFSIERPTNNLVYKDRKKKNYEKNDSTKSLVDPSWELVDPTPNIHILFFAFNDKFFWKKLGTVSVSWSKRMTSCAGVCTYECRGGECKITLSEPLLKLRPRKDLIETLLHEMIHAYLFVTHNNRDRDGHGPEFHKHMFRINSEAGTNITVYHDFHDEVRLYQQHVWRCNGPCQKRRPFYGIVRRAMNRAPGPYDRWFPEHQATCGGTFIKIKEPEKSLKVKQRETNKENKTNGDITKYVVVTKGNKTNGVKKPDLNIKTINNIKTNGDLGVKNMNGTVVLNPKTAKNIPPQNTPNKKFGNIVTIKDLDNNSIATKTPNKNTIKSPISDDSSIDYSVVRNKWLTKFNNTDNKNDKIDRKRKSSDNNISSPKKIKTEDSVISIGSVKCPVCLIEFPDCELNDHLDQCLMETEKKDVKKPEIILVECPCCNNFFTEIELNVHLDKCLQSQNSVELTTSKDKCSGTTSPQPTGSKTDTSKEDLMFCLICETYVNPDIYDRHAEACLNKYYDDVEKKYNLNTSNEKTSCLVCNKDILKTELDSHLENCDGSAFDGSIVEEIEDDEDDKNEEKKHPCPVCMTLISEDILSDHVNLCLTKNIDFNEDF